jgi:hypothetical protein
MMESEKRLFGEVFRSVHMMESEKRLFGEVFRSVHFAIACHDRMDAG